MNELCALVFEVVHDGRYTGGAAKNSFLHEFCGDGEERETLEADTYGLFAGLMVNPRPNPRNSQPREGRSLCSAGRTSPPQLDIVVRGCL